VTLVNGHRALQVHELDAMAMEAVLGERARIEAEVQRVYTLLCDRYPAPAGFRHGGYDDGRIVFVPLITPAAPSEPMPSIPTVTVPAAPEIPA
jgi:hypothetical protein